jgi:hypothetical protein
VAYAGKIALRQDCTDFFANVNFANVNFANVNLLEFF